MATPTATTTPPTAAPPGTGALDAQQQAIIDQAKGLASQKHAIGVPDTYKVTKQPGPQDDPSTGQFNPNYWKTAPPSKDVGVQYWEGDQLYPAGWDPAAILQLQLQMKDAGVYGKQKFTPGVWDQVSQDAMGRVMGYANGAGVSKEDIMTRWKQYANPKDNQQGAVLTVKNPEDIKNVLQGAAGKIIGRSLSEGELNTLVAGYQNIDRSAQEAQAAAQATASTNSTTESYQAAPSVNDYAIDQLKAKFKPEVDWVTANSRMKDFYSILGEGGGRAPMSSIGGTPNG